MVCLVPIVMSRLTPSLCDWSTSCFLLFIVPWVCCVGMKFFRLIGELRIPERRIRVRVKASERRSKEISTFVKC